MTTADRIRTLIAKDFNIEPAQLTDDALLQDLGVDSIGMAEVIFNVEDEFDLKLPETAVQLSTFGDVVRFIDEAIAAQTVDIAPGNVTESAGATAAAVQSPP